MSPEELARAWMETFNRGDFDANRALGAEDGWFGITAPSAGTSRDQAVEDGRNWKAAFPDAQGEISGVLVRGDDVAMEVRWVGTNAGSVMGMPPTNKPVEVNAAVFVTARGGKITRLMHYFDLAGLMAQRGMLPTPGQ